MADTLWFFDVSLQCRKENGLIIYAKSKIGNKGNHAKENRKNTGKNKQKNQGKRRKTLAKRGNVTLREPP